MRVTVRYVLGLGAALTATALAHPAVLSAQGVGRGQQVLVWAPKPTELTPYNEPHRPLWKLSDIRAMHQGHASWRQPIIRDHTLEADYVQYAPGEKTPRIFFGDTRSFFIVWEGQVRVNINGVEPFVATKGYMVQVPMMVDYDLEVLGDSPALVFEVRVAYSPIYYADINTQPPAVPGVTWYRGSRIAPRPARLDTTAVVPTYADGARVYVDFMKEVVGGEGPFRNGAFVRDDRMFANIIRGQGAPPPPPSDLGHFHTYGTEFWFIPEGQIDVQIEGIDELVTGFPGDIITAARGRFHRASWGGTGMSTRIAINGYPNGLHVYQTPEGD